MRDVARKAFVVFVETLLDAGRRLAGTVIDLATSKKAIATVVGLILTHIIADPVKRAEVAGVIMSFVLSQGIVDHAKEKAKAALGVATATVSTSTPVAPAPLPLPDITGA